MSKQQHRAEEQFPLLLFLVGDEDNSKDNKRFASRSRFDGITSGATAVLTEWPNYISSCWVTTLICGIVLFMTSLLLTSCMSFESSHRLPRCLPSGEILVNKTIHLAHDSHPWTQNQLDLLENITKAFPNYAIHITAIKSHTSLFRQSRKRRNQLFNAIIKSNNTKSAKSSPSIEDFVGKHPKILLTYKNYNDIFDKTPLFISWVMMSEQMRIFAIRIMQIWQHGGISYDLMRPTSNALRFERNKNNTTQTVEKESLADLIVQGSKEFEQLEDGMVSVDNEGLHMATRTPCHAFFGKVLMRLKKASTSTKTTPRLLLKGAMYTFCKAGAVLSAYCDNLVAFI